MTNFQQRVTPVSKYGTIKGVLWHQGESDTNDQSIPGMKSGLKKFLKRSDNVVAIRIFPYSLES